MSETNDQRPLTLSQLKEFYQDVMKPDLKREIRQEIKQDVRQEVSSQLLAFYRGIMKPEFEETIEEKIAPLRMEMLRGFDDLYRKHEVMHQEMTIMNHHLRRLDEAVFGKKGPNVH